MRGRQLFPKGGSAGNGLWALTFLVAVGALLVGIWWLLGFLVENNAGSFFDGFDRGPVEFFVDRRSDRLTTFMRGVTFLGGTVATTLLLSGAALVSYAGTKNHRWPGFFVGVLVGAWQLARVIKPLVGRARPDFQPVYEVASDAFPSGHAAASAACFGALAYWAVLNLRRPWSVVAWAGAALIVALVGVTRVYLGVHWPTDVIAGWVLGAAWVLAVRRVTRPFSSEGE